jgi:hypothetical protein
MIFGRFNSYKIRLIFNLLPIKKIDGILCEFAGSGVEGTVLILMRYALMVIMYISSLLVNQNILFYE